MDEFGFFSPSQPPMQQQASMPSVENPGGGPQANQSIPLEGEIDIVIAALKRLATDLSARGLQPEFANELDTMANKVTRRKLSWQKEVTAAAEKGMGVVMSQQL